MATLIATPTSSPWLDANAFNPLDGQDEQPQQLTISHPTAITPAVEVSVTKNKSTSSTAAAEKAPHRLSFDESATYDLDNMSKSPIIPEHEHGLGASGLRRIRQSPPSQRVLTPTSVRSASSSHSEIYKSTLQLPQQRSSSGSVTPRPISPTTHEFSEDLTRFPSESLHSFSFAHQPDDSIHSRQNVLRRSIDFMRGRMGWAAINPAMAQAQAKLSGDQEMQSMMELLARANQVGQSATAAHGLSLPGPITGPADMTTLGNVFEKSFMSQSEKPDSIGPLSPRSLSNATTPTATVTAPPFSLDSATPETTIATPSDRDAFASAVSPSSTVEEMSIKSRPSLDKLTIPSRGALKRTLTSVDDVSLHNKLSKALSEPYVVNENVGAGSDMSRTALPSALGQFQSIPWPNATPLTAGAAPHGHYGGRVAPAVQAVFTTESHAPWTITAANDLACLVFGVTRAEVRKIGILEVVSKERWKWLEEKLRDPEGGSLRGRGNGYSQSTRTSPQHTTMMNVGNGITAKLLSKPSSRVTGVAKPKGRIRSQSDDGAGSTFASKSKVNGSPSHQAHKSRGVLLCGDVVPIQKRNGASGSASLWVNEKRGGLIWVLEEIAEDTVYINVDETGCVDSASGATEAIWGYERIRRGMDLKRLIPAIPRMKGTHTGALDYDKVAEMKTYTARTANSINIPVTVRQMSGRQAFRISSFPHIAGIMVLNSGSLHITSSNTVFSDALFGQAKPDGMHINELVPAFDRILRVMTDEDKIRLIDGIVIPEHNFRRARALLAMREGKGDAASVFLKPSGLPAKHRDGSDIMVDVQMRVVKSDRSRHDDIIEERSEDEAQAEAGDFPPPDSEVVYALWITYSRQLHAANHGLGPMTPFVSRPGTPPHQPSPGQTIEMVNPDYADGSNEVREGPVSLLTQRLRGHLDPPAVVHTSSDSSLSTETSNTTSSSTALAAETDSTPTAASSAPTKKKTISDFAVIEDMGQGAYGQVKLCRYKHPPGNKVVIKYVTKRRILVDTWTRDRTLGTVPLEIHVLDYLRRLHPHPNIVEMADFFEDETNYYIEMVPHGLPGMDLFDYIELRVNMEEEECRRIFVQVARAVGWLHGRAGVVHRDIKDENVVLDGEGRCRLIDFGSATYVRNGPFDVFVGTIDYAAPEVLSGGSYRGKEQDVWALGILLYTIVYRENPFYSIDEILDHDLRVPYVISEESIDLIRKMLNRDVEERITIGEVLEHEWCKSVEGISEG